ncbi:MAG TPA: 2'-5' RNA ligase family protein [Streptosporangiaceae bacterium]|nr:2'-5' RNA ligase family protein [Streptosporangiaceae bacterium]
MTSAAARVRAIAAGAMGRASVWVRPASILIVPVLAAEPAVAAWLGQERVAFDGAPLHVTVMFPFLPARSLDAAEEEGIADLAHETEPFCFALARLGQFPGVQYLAPEPAAPFIAVTDRIQRRWPACRPYDGMYSSVVPHMTVAVAERLPADPGVLERELPIRTRADELWLLEQTVRGWRTRRRFPLGGRLAAVPAEVRVASQ